MSQQELVPESQSQEKQPLDAALRTRRLVDEIDSPQHPYYWSTRPDTKAIPKDEPTASYDEPMLQNDYQNGYIAQDYPSHSIVRQGAQTKQYNGTRNTYSQQAQIQTQAQSSKYGSDGDAFEQTYRSNYAPNQQWKVPPWARPQIHKRNPSIIGILVFFGFLFIYPIVHVIATLLAFVGVTLLVLLLLFLVIVIVGIPYVILRFAFGKGRVRSRPGHWRRNIFWLP